jgi:BirA family biotin operon repressor/biotin-[acetyl-CoA-carboxylase] ligase
VNDLAEEAIARELTGLGGPPDLPVSVLAVTRSTNDDARDAAARGAAHGSLFVADAQTAGRGRGGHAWYSPAGENLYLSVVLRPRLPAASVAPVTLAVGVAVARALERALESAGARAALWVKWPNDVLAGVERRKLAGVLAEGQLRGNEVTSLVVGVGVNVHGTSFPPELGDRATSLALLGARTVSRSALAARLARAITEAVASYEGTRLASFAADLARLDALRGAPVEVGALSGTACGIDADGRLLVASEGRVTPVVSGEVSTRLSTREMP